MAHGRTKQGYSVWTASSPRRARKRERYKSRQCLNRLCTTNILKSRHLMQILWNDFTFGSDGAPRIGLRRSSLPAGLKGRPCKLALCISMRTDLKSRDTAEQTSGVCKQLCCVSFSPSKAPRTVKKGRRLRGRGKEIGRKVWHQPRCRFELNTLTLNGAVRHTLSYNKTHKPTV